MISIKTLQKGTIVKVKGGGYTWIIQITRICKNEVIKGKIIKTGQLCDFLVENISKIITVK